MVLVEMLIEDPLPILSHVCRLPKARKQSGERHFKREGTTWSNAERIFF